MCTLCLARVTITFVLVLLVSIENRSVNLLMVFLSSDHLCGPHEGARSGDGSKLWQAAGLTGDFGS